MPKVSLELEGAEGLPFHADLHLPARGGTPFRGPIVLFMHGFKGFKDWGPWGALCDRFAESGVAALRFDLSHNGVGEDGVAFSALDRFERNTIAAELADLAAARAWVRAADLVEPSHLFLWGHSRGGGGVLLGAGEDPGELTGIVTWAAISTYERGWAVEAIERWDRGESVPVWNKRTEQMMPLGPDLYRDYLAHRVRYDIPAATRKIGSLRIPLLLVHGEEDETVPVEEAEVLRDAYGDGGGAQVEVVRVPGGDHTLGTKHPFNGWTEPLEAAFDATLRFVREHRGGDVGAPR